MDENALQYLKHYGYLTEAPPVAPGGDPLVAAIEQFQRFVGLPVTGLMDAATLEMMQRPRCGNPDVLHVTGDALPAKWQKPVINVWVESWLPTAIVPQSVQEGIIATALGNKEAWGEHITSKFRLIATGRYDIKIFCARIDGPGSILAQAYLADGRDSQLTLQLDSSEAKWGLVKGSAEANLLGVLQHELTHNLGLGHLQVREALMFPYANSNIISPQKPDIEAVLRLGYQKAAGDPPPPPPPPPEDDPMNWQAIIIVLPCLTFAAIWL